MRTHHRAQMLGNPGPGNCCQHACLQDRADSREDSGNTDSEKQRAVQSPHSRITLTNQLYI